MHRTDYGNIKIVLRTPPSVTSTSMKEADGTTLMDAIMATGLVEGLSISWLEEQGMSFNMPVPEWAVEDGDTADEPKPEDVRVCKWCRCAIVPDSTANWVHLVTFDGRRREAACEPDMQSNVAWPEEKPEDDDDDAVTPELHPGSVIAHIHTDSTGQFVGPLEKNPTMFVYENRKGNIFKGHYNQWKVV